jgi:hypothetical protein
MHAMVLTMGVGDVYRRVSPSSALRTRAHNSSNPVLAALGLATCDYPWKRSCVRFQAWARSRSNNKWMRSAQAWLPTMSHVNRVGNLSLLILDRYLISMQCKPSGMPTIVIEVCIAYQRLLLSCNERIMSQKVNRALLACKGSCL